jgi:hypothetical protein
VKARRATSRVAALVGASPAEVLGATVLRGGAALSPAERGMRTAAAVRHVPVGWHWPRWLDRQSRPDHPAFVPPGDAGVTENLTGRDWRYVGTVSSGWLAKVDPRGAVVPVTGGWSLDWLVRAEDRWHRPAREAAGIRQRAHTGAPVPETACRVPGGDIVQRVFGATMPGDLGDAVVVEIENTTSVPVAIAFAVRPVDLLGVGAITTIGWDDTTVLVDGRPSVLFDRRPAQGAVGDGGLDSLTAVLADGASDEAFAPRRDPLGLANAAFVVPLPHRASLRVVLPLRGDRRDRPSLEGVAPTGDDVVRGWDAHADRATRIELPDERLSHLYAAAVRTLLLASGDGAVAAPHGNEDRWTVAAEARIVRALHLVGLHEPANAVVRRRGDEFELDGWFRRESPSLARNAAIFHAVGDAWTLSHDRATVDAVIGPTVKAAHWSERFRARRSRAIANAEAYALHDALSSLAHALVGVEQPDAAQDVAAFAARFVLDHEPEPPVDTSRIEIPAGAPAGLDSLATVDGAITLAAAGDERALLAVSWLTEVAGEHGRWPTFVHPRLGTGCGGSGDDPVVAAATVELMRTFALHVDGRTIALLPLVPTGWLGQPVDVRDAPTPHGRCSFSIRWHGERPALLWELVTAAPDNEGTPFEITIPGLDPAFRTEQRAGEALLAAPDFAGATPADPGASFR